VINLGACMQQESKWSQKLNCLHPNWSPVTVKSAIMTTGDVVLHVEKPIMDEKLHPENYFF
jgi:hypothetical protein